MIFYYRPKGTIPHHRPQRDDTSSSSPKGRFIIVSKGRFIIVPKGRFFLLSSQGTIHHHHPFGIIFHHRSFGMIFHYRPKGMIFFIILRDDSSSSSLWNDFLLLPL